MRAPTEEVAKRVAADLPGPEVSLTATTDCRRARPRLNTREMVGIILPSITTRIEIDRLELAGVIGPMSIPTFLAIVPVDVMSVRREKIGLHEKTDRLEKTGRLERTGPPERIGYREKIDRREKIGRRETTGDDGTIEMTGDMTGTAVKETMMTAAGRARPAVAAALSAETGSEMFTADDIATNLLEGLLCGFTPFSTQTYIRRFPQMGKLLNFLYFED